MVLTLDLETWFKVTAHQLLKGFYGWSMIPIGTKEEKICSEQAITGGRTDRLIILVRSQSEAIMIVMIFINLWKLLDIDLNFSIDDVIFVLLFEILTWNDF